MIITRHTDPDISLALIPYFIETEKTRLDIGWELHERLKNNPDDTLCLAGTENGYLHGLLIAYLREKDVWLWQVRADSKFRKYSRMVYGTFEGWVRYKKHSKIRGGSLNERVLRYFCRCYGYKPGGRGEIVKNVNKSIGGR